MSNGLVIQIETGGERRTEVLSADLIRIGPGEDCDVRIISSALPFDYGAALEITRSNGNYQVKEVAATVSITHNGKPLMPEQVIADGDRIYLGSPDLALRFFTVRDLPAVVTGRRRRRETEVAPFIEQAAIEAAATARRDDAKVFLREFSRELLREIKPSTKLATLAIAAALVFGVLYLGYAAYREMQRSRQTINDQNEVIAQLREIARQTNHQLGEVNRSTEALRDSLSWAPRIRSTYGNGVALIAGSFMYVEARTGRPLRYPDAQMNEDGSAAQTEGQTSQLTPEGNGAIARFDFVGTGFHVGGGYILTNRHIVQPWVSYESAMSVSVGAGAQPRLSRMLAYFPDRRQPIPLRLRQVSTRDDVDLAVCSLELAEVPPEIPTLPLDSGSDAVAVGRDVVMMGYPSGPDRLIILLPEQEQNNIRARSMSLEALLGNLAERDLINPLTTKGSITDLPTRRIVYDARTGDGGSGAPVFGQSGRVIGVNFAIFTENAASNFGVPISSALPLLRRAGWEPSEPLNETPAPSPAQRDARANAPASPARN